VAAAGDVNGDGYADILVGAYAHSSSAGRAYVFYGGPSLVSKSAANADVILSGESATNFGLKLASAGDVNGDGRGDIIVGATEYSSLAGRAYVFYGGASLVSKPATSADVVLTGEASSRFGVSVGSAGDVNGDGFPDLIVGAYFYSSTTGRAYVFYGGPNLSNKNAAGADVILTGETGSAFGIAVATAGDVNGDGRGDVIVGASGYSTSTGRAYIFFGGPTLVSKPAANASVILTGEATGNNFASTISSAGDVNGDGRGDVIVGAYAVLGNTGRAYVFLGGSGLVTKPAANADLIFQGDGFNNMFGSSVAGAGDLNRDGFGDLLVGAVESTRS
jgi:hypothetical protein